ncbi:MAG: aldehyde dehydrogenase family protein [Sphingorhabdus sp.]
MHALSASTTSYLATTRNFLLGGQWKAGRRGTVLPCFDPASEQQIGEVFSATAADVEDAVQAARAAFDDRRWRGKTPAERQGILLKVADLILRDAEILAELETINGGKLFGSALCGEIPHAAETFRYYAGWVTKLGGRLFEPSVPGRQYHGFVREDPIGVAALITPWNGALVAAAWKLAPALAAGCSCILKPAELTPLSSLYLCALLQEAGVPEGVVNILPGTGSDVGATLVRHRGVGKISFTGSTEVGRRLLVDSAENVARVSLELGGKSPFIIFADADLEMAIGAAAEAIFSNAGQVCVAGSRLYAEREVFNEVVEAITFLARSYRLGPGFDPQSTMGPLISRAHRDRVHMMVEDARSDGAEVVTGGSRFGEYGHYYSPTVIVDAAPSSAIVQNEVFGPVVVVTAFEGESEALKLANDSNYGLAASLWTRDTSRALRLASDVEAGIIWINDHGIPELSMPIGGVKHSGLGREHGIEGLKAFTEPRSVMLRL